MSAGHWASDRRPGDGHRPSSLNGSSTNRYHHLVKTFWGWGEKRLPDGTLILTSPAGHTYVTTPGSALLFSSLCLSTGGIPAPEADPPPDSCAERTAMMPKRGRTRAQTAPTASPPNAAKTTPPAPPSGPRA